MLAGMEASIRWGDPMPLIFASAAVENSGMSRRRAAAQFGGCGGDANRQCCTGQDGGHKSKAIAGEHRAWLLQRVSEKDFTLRGLVAEFAERGQGRLPLGLEFRSCREAELQKKRHGQRTRASRRRPQAGAVDQVPAPDRSYIVIIDNLGSHKGKAVRQLILAARAKLFFLPKYSPDLNPIEQVFAKLKHLLRKCDAARTPDATCDAIVQLLPVFSPEECGRYFQHGGYAPT
jgi:hypothetical protein